MHILRVVENVKNGQTLLHLSYSHVLHLAPRSANVKWDVWVSQIFLQANFACLLNVCKRFGNQLIILYIIQVIY